MKLKFNLTSKNGALVDIELVMQKTCGLVAVGEIKNGSISKGDTVSVQAGDKVAINHQVKRIEINHEEVATADKGQTIGICLGNILTEELVQYLKPN